MRRWAPVLAAVGVLAGVVVATLAARHAPSPLGSPLEPRGGWKTLWCVGLGLAFVLYLAGLALIRRRTAHLAAVVALAAAIQLVPLAAPLMLSRDAFVYWDYGRIAAIHDGNPYRQLPERWPDDPAYARMGSDWHRTYDAYGPAWTLAGEAHAHVVGADAHDAGVGYKWIAAAGMLVLIAAAALFGPFAAAFVGWSPLLALQFAGGGHNDAWMMGFVLLALAAAARGRGLVAGFGWTLAVAVKWFPLLVLPLELARARLSPRRFPLVGLAAAAVVVAAMSSLFYGPWWVRAAVPISNQLQRSSTNSLPYYLAKIAGSQRGWSVVLGVLFALAYLWLLRTAWTTGRARRGLAAGLFCLSLSWLTPWYATWPVALAAIEEDVAARLLALALSAYLLQDALPL